MKDGQANYVDYEIILYSKPACQSNQVGTHAVFVINDEFQRCALRCDTRFASLWPVIRRIFQIFLPLKIVTIARNSVSWTSQKRDAMRIAFRKRLNLNIFLDLSNFIFPWKPIKN